MEIKQNPMPAMPLLLEPPPWNDPTRPPSPAKELGRTLMGNMVTLHNPWPRQKVMVVAGAHGDESEAVFLGTLLALRQNAFPVIPCLNLDGALLRQRWNARNVDLNRNMPTRDWSPKPVNPRFPPGHKPVSEPETRAFLDALDWVAPQIVFSLHSFKETFLEVERLPETLAPALNQAVATFTEGLGIERRLSIGYPTPGSLGSYGREHGLLVLTFELLRGTSHEDIHNMLPQVMALLETLDQVGFKPPEGEK
ncbi:MAG: M14 family zinc carboxypeptidase [Deltaproteobacteria bacterium]|nr:M14 family zinc carboxypeptidase [Deltaproteobacteria bacterium]